MSTFVDTSALIALLDGDDRDHLAVAGQWRRLLDDDEPLVVSNYVLVEAYALAQRRLGVEAIAGLSRDFVPLLTVDWVDEATHAAAVAALLAAGRRRLSLVDCASFLIMRRRGLVRAFSLDADFVDQGFDVIPGRSPRQG